MLLCVCIIRSSGGLGLKCSYCANFLDFVGVILRLMFCQLHVEGTDVIECLILSQIFLPSRPER